MARGVFTWQRSPDGTYMNPHSAAFSTSPLRRALALVALGTLACAATGTALAQDAKRADQVRAYNAQVLKLQAEQRRAGGPANGRAADVLAARADGPAWARRISDCSLSTCAL